MRHEDFTVGWICAVQTEYVAACELLDEEYPKLPIDSPHDSNAYTLGRIGDHHIVIASLPKGRYGIASAASVAKDMVRSFRFIRFGLMVGIGGGAPSDKHDIRLGDVVVGCPVKKEGGVVPYNYGKATQFKEFERTGSLNSPPTVLLTALNNLEMHHARKGINISKSASMLITRNPRLKGKYRNPGAEHDRLYESSYTHGGSNTCEIDCDSASPPLLQRPRRELDPDEPAVHYGLIASADILMEDATVRDRLADENDILCFETEAAGLMNDFQCAVIRGICDYSDTHKNDAWQGYAAVTAALYAKELLSMIPEFQVANTQLANSEIVKPHFSVPYERDPNFIDRKDIFAQIEEQLQTYHRASLHGIGGIGKSQIAIEYAYRIRGSHPQSHVFWVHAASCETFLQAYREIARDLKLAGYDDPKVDSGDLVLRWLKEEDHQWLMILDNADNPSLLFPPTESDIAPTPDAQTQRPLIDYLPSILDSQKSLLVTTRSRHIGQDLAHGESCVGVHPFSSQEAADLFRSKLGVDVTDSSDASSIESLVNILGCIPLAITQAAAFIKRNQMTIQDYPAALEKDKQNLTEHLSQELQDTRRPRGSPNSVFRTWRLSFDQIQRQDHKAAELLSLMAMLAPQRIPKELLRTTIDRDIDFSMAIGTLHGFALITSEIGGVLYAMHPLVQASVHYWLAQRGKKAGYAGQALELLANEFPHAKHENKDTCELLFTHAKAVLSYNCVSQNDLRRRARLLYKLGDFNWQQCRSSAAYIEASDAYKIFQDHDGELADSTLNSLHLLGIVLGGQGHYKAAEKIMRRALAGREEASGLDHPDTLAVVLDLATVFGNQGKYPTAEKFARRALESREKALGPEHSDTLVNVNNLATILCCQGKYGSAEDMGRRALAGQEKVLGLEHPETLITLKILASVLQDQMKFEIAEEMVRRVLAGREKLYGPEHLHTLTSASNLALLLADMGRNEEAEEMSRRALEGRVKVLGDEHPQTLSSINGLGYVLEEQGKYKAAEELCRQALEGYEKVLGVEHPGTLTSVHNLAWTLQRQKRYDDASVLYIRAFEGRTKVLGPDHPLTLNCSQNYSLMLDEIERENTEGMASEEEDEGEKEDKEEGNEEVPDPWPESSGDRASRSPQSPGTHSPQKNKARKTSRIPIRSSKPARQTVAVRKSVIASLNNVFLTSIYSRRRRTIAMVLHAKAPQSRKVKDLK